MLARRSGEGQTSAGIVGIGIDLVELDRMRGILARRGPAFVSRVFNDDERCAADDVHAPAHYAARFAAKEACLKALGTGLASGVLWRDLSVRRGEGGAPTLDLSGRAGELAARRGVRAVHVSLTHGRDHAAAVVVLER